MRSHQRPAAGVIAGAITSRMKRAWASRRSISLRPRKGAGWRIDPGVDVEPADPVLVVVGVLVAAPEPAASTQPSEIMNSPQAWSESIGKSVWSRSKRQSESLT